MKFTFKIEPDYCPDPTEDDMGWKLVSFSQNHSLFQHPDKLFRVTRKHGSLVFTARNISLRRRLDVGLAFMLSYYEHGECKWFRKGCGGPGTNCPWDGVVHAGVLIWEHGPAEIGAKTYEDRAKGADTFLRCYTDWWNGHGLSWSAVGDDNETQLDSCGGYYDSDVDYLIQDMVTSARGDLGQGDTWEIHPESAYEYKVIKAFRDAMPELEHEV